MHLFDEPSAVGDVTVTEGVGGVGDEGVGARDSAAAAAAAGSGGADGHGNGVAVADGAGGTNGADVPG